MTRIAFEIRLLKQTNHLSGYVVMPTIVKELFKFPFKGSLAKTF